MVIREREFFIYYYKSFPAFMNLFDFLMVLLDSKQKTKQNTNLKLPIMKKLLFMAIIATGLSFVSCTAETESIEPIQNENIEDDPSVVEGEPYIKKDKD